MLDDPLQAKINEFWSHLSPRESAIGLVIRDCAVFHSYEGFSTNIRFVVEALSSGMSEMMKIMKIDAQESAAAFREFSESILTPFDELHKRCETELLDKINKSIEAIATKRANDFEAR